ncbi:unnamed protein product [Amoebophrya sp. A25]|nr:unnamed protein product [Amoebophrya sp. A25]|eukprot:GSA25T00020474001.1
MCKKCERLRAALGVISRMLRWTASSVQRFSRSATFLGL